MSMSHNEMIAVIAAHRDGKKIERKWAKGGMAILEKWDECGPPFFFNFSDWEYRIKPEPPKPREWWMLKHGGDPPCAGCGIFTSRAEALSAANSNQQRSNSVLRVREVLPDEEGKA